MCAGTPVSQVSLCQTHVQEIDKVRILYMIYMGRSAFASCQVQYFGMSVKLDLKNVLDSLGKLFYCLLNLSVREKMINDAIVVIDFSMFPCISAIFIYMLEAVGV